MHKITRYHDISAGHRVVGHESKCQFLHGHNYRVHFTCVKKEEYEGQLDDLGRVIDFGVIKEKLCMWLENHWDHKMLLWVKDPVANICDDDFATEDEIVIRESIVKVPFNPTAENMAQYLVEVIGPRQLKLTDVRLMRVKVEETRKCSASYTHPYYK